MKHDLLRVDHWFTDAALELASQSLVPRRESVHPERRIGSGQDTYDDILLLNELPDYEAAWDRGLQRGTRGCETTQ